MSDNDEKLEPEVRRLLDEDLGCLDERTCERLRQARRKALDEARGAAGQRRNWWLPAGAAVACAAIAAVIWFETRPPVAPAMTPPDFELLITRDSLDLYRDLDFYQWLARERSPAG